MILPPNQNVFTYPYATYSIVIDHGAFLVGPQDPLRPCATPTPKVETSVRVDGARVPWDRTPNSVDEFRREVLKEIAYQTPILTHDGMLSHINQSATSNTKPESDFRHDPKEHRLHSEKRKPIHIFPLRHPPRLTFGAAAARYFVRWSFDAQSFVRVQHAAALALIDQHPTALPTSPAATSWRGPTSGADAPYQQAPTIVALAGGSESESTGGDNGPFEKVTYVRASAKGGAEAQVSFVHVPKSHFMGAGGCKKCLRIVVEMKLFPKAVQRRGSYLQRNSRKGSRGSRREVSRHNMLGTDRQEHTEETEEWKKLIEYDCDLAELHSSPCMPDRLRFPELYETYEFRHERDGIVGCTQNAVNKLDAGSAGVGTTEQPGTGTFAVSASHSTPRCVTIVPRGELFGVHDEQLLAWERQDKQRYKPNTSSNFSTSRMQEQHGNTFASGIQASDCLVKVEGNETMLPVSSFLQLAKPGVSTKDQRKATRRNSSSFLGVRLQNRNITTQLDQVHEPCRVSIWPPSGVVAQPISTGGSRVSAKGSETTPDPITAAVAERTSVFIPNRDRTEWMQLGAYNGAPLDAAAAKYIKHGMGPCVVHFNPFTCEYRITLSARHRKHANASTAGLVEEDAVPCQGHGLRHQKGRR